MKTNNLISSRRSFLKTAGAVATDPAARTAQRPPSEQYADPQGQQDQRESYYRKEHGFHGVTQSAVPSGTTSTMRVKASVA